MVTFGGTVADIRKQRKMTQLALATAAGLSRNSISLIERNETGITVDTLCRLASALGIKAESLLSVYRRQQKGEV
jgi:transcriptional regulator with XRE-family HTH domain